MEETTTAPNRTVIILLGIIVLLLAAIAGYFILGGNKGGATADTNTGTNAPAASNGTPTPAASTPFDPATATKVPAGETPEQHVTAYFEAVLASDFQTAYDRLPADKKAAQDVAAFGEQLKAYGVQSYRIDSATEEGEEAQVTATASMAGGEFQYLWTFVKDGDGWLLKSRTLPGMGQ